MSGNGPVTPVPQCRDGRLSSDVRRRIAQGQPTTVIRGNEGRNFNTTDGVKLIFDDQTWLLFRLSGTEPVARVYAEACSPKDLKKVIDAGKKFVA
jgi:phosphomannomutase